MFSTMGTSNNTHTTDNESTKRIRMLSDRVENLQERLNKVW